MDDEGDEDMMSAPSPVYANGHSASAPAPAPVRQQPPAQSRPAPPQPKPQPPPAEGDILGVFEEPASGPATGNLLDQGQPSVTHGEGSLLDMTGGSYNEAPNSNGGSNHSDFMGMTATAAPVAASAPTPAPIPAASTSGSYGARPISQQSNIAQKVQPPRSGNAAGLSLKNSGPFGGLNWD